MLITGLAVVVLCAAVWYFASAGRKPSGPPARTFDLVQVFEQAGAQAVQEEIVRTIGKHKARKAMSDLAEMFRDDPPK